MATKKPNPSPAPLVILPVSNTVLPDLPDLPTEDDGASTSHFGHVVSEPIVMIDPAVSDPSNDVDPANLAERRFADTPKAAPVPGTMQVKIKQLSDRARTPTYGSAGAACFDLYAADTLAVAPGRSATVPTDLAFEVPEGYVMMAYSRSGHGFKNSVRLANCTGVIDSDYRGNMLVSLHNDGRDVFYVRQGDRIAQAMIIPVPRIEFIVADELSSTERGENGGGSTGR